MTTNFENKVKNIAASFTITPDQLIEVAAVYAEIMTDMNEAVTKARMAVEKIPPNVEGIVELKQLLVIMDGQFVTVARRVIEKATASMNPEPEEPED